LTGRTAKVAILMATHDGMPWLAAQIESILSQQEVEVTLFISDDASSDGTWEWLQERGKVEPRLRLLSRTQTFGSAALNFFRLVREADWQGADYIGFSDQDDIWLPEKLKRHADLLSNHDWMGVSSNVIATWSDGGRRLLDKAQPVQAWDFVFESAGPGCTYLMKPALMEQLRALLLEQGSVAMSCELHDWLAYAVCRAQGKAWHIDPEPSVLYRQHESNAFGANVGMKALMSRLRRTFNGWHRMEARKVVTSTQRLSANTKNSEGLQQLQQLLGERGLRSRMRLLRFAARGRRRGLHRLVLMLLVICGIW